MNSTRILNTWLCALLILLSAKCFARDDIHGSKDHPMISRFPGAVINRYDVKNFDEFFAPAGPAKNDKGFEKTIDLEGKVSRIGYLVGNEHSIVEIFRSYRNALRKSGFNKIFICKRKEQCGFWFTSDFLGLPELGDIWGPDSPSNRNSRYLLTRLQRPGGDVYAAILVYENSYNNPRVWEVIVETQALKKGLVTINADARSMAAQIKKSGRVALYGIYFDTDKALVKPESKPALTEIAKLMKNNPELKLIVVGHTDNQGGFDYNMKLSERRAKAVENALVKNYGAERSRLRHWGVGYLSPVASNHTEEGRAKNRRVELVEQ